jgi:hypothetical protein
MDPALDPEPDPALFVSDLQDADKNFFLCLLLFAGTERDALGQYANPLLFDLALIGTDSHTHDHLHKC